MWPLGTKMKPLLGWTKHMRSAAPGSSRFASTHGSIHCALILDSMSWCGALRQRPNSLELRKMLRGMKPMAAVSDSAGGAGDESLVKVQLASIGLLFPRQWENKRDAFQFARRSAADTQRIRE